MPEVDLREVRRIATRITAGAIGVELGAKYCGYDILADTLSTYTGLLLTVGWSIAAADFYFNVAEFHSLMLDNKWSLLRSGVEYCKMDNRWELVAVSMPFLLEQLSVTIASYIPL